jgi:hypothetical protein
LACRTEILLTAALALVHVKAKVSLLLINTVAGLKKLKDTGDPPFKIYEVVPLLVLHDTCTGILVFNPVNVSVDEVTGLVPLETSAQSIGSGSSSGNI